MARLTEKQLTARRAWDTPARPCCHGKRVCADHRRSRLAAAHALVAAHSPEDCAAHGCSMLTRPTGNDVRTSDYWAADIAGHEVALVMGGLVDTFTLGDAWGLLGDCTIAQWWESMVDMLTGSGDYQLTVWAPDGTMLGDRDTRYGKLSLLGGGVDYVGHPRR